MALWEHIWKSTPYKLYATDSPEISLSNLDSGIAVLNLRVEILIFKKIDFYKIEN